MSLLPILNVLKINLYFMQFLFYTLGGNKKIDSMLMIYQG